MRTLARAACAACVLAIASCANVPRSGPLPELVGVPAAFEMSGRISIREAQRSEIAKLRWTHRPGSDVWIFASPLGNEVARIESSAAGVTLQQAGAAEETAASFAALTQRFIGVPLDPETLASWLHGGSAQTSTAGWTVTMDETQRAGAVEIARRLSATRGDTTVRLVVDEYRALER